MLYLYTSADFVQMVLNRPGQPVVQYGFYIPSGVQYTITSVVLKGLQGSHPTRAFTLPVTPPKSCDHFFGTLQGEKMVLSFVTLDIAEAGRRFY